MNKKIPLRSLAESVSNRTGIDADKAQAFVKALFSVIGDKLLQAETVNVDGFGEFSASHNTVEPVRFLVDPTLADELNAPFAMFNSIDIPIGIDQDELKSISDDMLSKSESEDGNLQQSADSVKEMSVAVAEIENPVSEQVEVEHINENIDCADEVKEEVSADVDDTPVEIPTATTEDINTCETQELREAKVEIYEEPAVVVSSSIIPEEEEEYVEYSDEENEHEKSRFGIGFLLGLVTGLIIGALCFVGYTFYFVETGSKLF